MESNKQFDYDQAYYAIDDWGYGYIDRRNLKSFLKKHGYIASTEEVIAIIRRMDLDADARLTKQEFIDGIKPEEPYSRTMNREKSARKQSRNVTPSFSHTRKTSMQDSRDMLGHNKDQKDYIRTGALDRSINKVGQMSRSPLKSRPRIRNLEDSITYRTPNRHLKSGNMTQTMRTPTSGIKQNK